jgi:hypothetical protein
MTMPEEQSIAANEVHEIQRRMAQIRHELHDEVRQAVKGARSFTDWRSLVRRHPWPAVGAAAVVGYLVVPKRRRKVPAVVTVTPPASTLAAPAAASMAKPSQASRSGVFAMAFALLGPVVLHAVQNYAAAALEDWLARNSMGRPTAEPRSRSRSTDGPRVSPGPDASRGHRSVR